MAPRRLNPRLLDAFERAQMAPLDYDPSIEAPAAVEELPAPKSRFDLVREYLENRAPVEAPAMPEEPDMQSAIEADKRANFRRGMLAAGQAFLGNRRAPLEVRDTRENEAQARGDMETRRRALAAWAESQGRQRMGEAELLSRAAAEPARKDPELERERLDIDRQRVEQQGEMAQKRLDLEREKMEKRGGPKAAGPKLSKDASALRKEFNALPEVKAYKDTEASYNVIEKAAATPSAAGDLSLIFAYMKVLDPGSTVREGEFAAAAAAAGTDQRLLGALEKVRSGQKLTPAQRTDFVARARDLRAARLPSYTKAAEMYRGLAERAGARPDDVVSLEGTTQPAGDKPDATVTVRQKSSGRTKRLSAAAARALADDPDFEVVP